MKASGSRRVANGLVAMGSAAVLTVYAAGFMRTRAAAQRLAGADEHRRVAPAPAEAGGSGAPAFIEPPSAVERSESRRPPAPPTSEVANASPAAPTTPAPATKHTAKTPATPAVNTPTASVPATDATTSTPSSTIPATTAAPASAPATVPPVTASDNRTADPAPAPKPASLYKDGTYSGWGTSRHGDIQAAVVIENGRIVSAYITQCLTRYSCSWIAHLPPQIVSRQSPECDYVSGATQSTNAFYYAIVEALSKAK